MRLTRVTITGADDSISPGDLTDLSKEFPFVEWGILFSASRQGREPRYPSSHWLDELLQTKSLLESGAKFSAHLCGQISRDVLAGHRDFMRCNFMTSLIFKRVQLNGFSQQSDITSPFWYMLIEHPNTEFIMQAHVPIALWATKQLRDAGHFPPRNISALYDPSGGKGLVSKIWPRPPSHFEIGYAGGIGLDNVDTVITQITSMEDDLPFWIDMESSVRSTDDSSFLPAVTTDGFVQRSSFDLNIVREILKKAAPWVSFR